MRQHIAERLPKKKVIMSRFHIKVNPFGGVVLKDRHAPAFVRSYSSLDAACFAMDNRVRREMGLPDRPQITRREIRDAMAVYARVDRERLDREMTEASA
jgi:hypothetical protein